MGSQPLLTELLDRGLCLPPPWRARLAAEALAGCSVFEWVAEGKEEEEEEEGAGGGSGEGGGGGVRASLLAKVSCLLRSRSLHAPVGGILLESAQL